MSFIPQNIPEGAVRYNTDSNKMEVYIGSTWMEVAVSSPNLDGGARGLIMGGHSPGAPNSGRLNNIEFVTITSAGNSQDFGDLTSVGRSSTGSCASRIRGLAMGGFDESAPAYRDIIDFVTISSTGNATDFGNLTINRQPCCSFSNATRGCCAGGYAIAPLISPNQNMTTIDFVTIAAEGNAVDFGDMTVAFRSRDSCQSPTRGIMAGGYSSVGSESKVIDFVTIATTGNAQDFGDIGTKFTSYAQNGYGSSTRGVFPLCDSNDSGNYVCDTLDFITLSTLGNPVEYGDLTTSRAIACSFSDSTRGILVGGATPDSDDIDYNNIATGGTSVDFGEYSPYSKLSAASGCSNGHGGL